MKKLILLALLLPLLVQAQLYDATVEAGDTLVAANPDTTDRILLYDDTDNKRPVNPTLWIVPTEIGTNTTHLQLQVITEIAATALSKASNDWFTLNTQTFYISDSDIPIIMAMPFLEGLTAVYGRWRLEFVDGRAADSTSYTVTYTADKGTPINRPYARSKTITHQQLVGANTALMCNGTFITNTNVVDLRIEVSPGVYQIPTKGWLTVYKGSKADADSISFTMNAITGSLVSSAIDADSIDLTYLDIVYLSPALNGGAAFPEFAKFGFTNCTPSADDTTGVFLRLTLE